MVSLRTQWRTAAERVDAATPADRERVVDGLRALAILGIVVGHWLVTAVAMDGGISTPLAALPEGAPISWVLQTLGVFFFVGGWVNSRGVLSAEERGTWYGEWLAARLRRLARPVLVLAVVWVPVLLVLSVLGSAWLGVLSPWVGTIVWVLGTPLWFLVVYAVLTMLTPLAVGLDRRFGAWSALGPLGVVLFADLVRFGVGWEGPQLFVLSVLGGWFVGYQLGVARGRGGLAGTRIALWLIGAGVVGMAVLILLFNYPASAVGVTGLGRSNLNPPSLIVPALTAVQVGLVVLLWNHLARLLRRPGAWLATVVLNRNIMTVFLWHQAAMIVVTALLLPFGPVPGLHTSPDDWGWVLARLPWLVVFAVVLAAMTVAVGRFERPAEQPSQR
ncbi:acyltransferase [Longimycelium tulufanense]|uniref:Acyltransferase n=1 Tax=Longimycelium tulufanense TaxID=907463 RepID=A0A8J3CGL9_9PSEU|nr:acyltransferase [Longimycelium tulufanense]GGM57958.1 acyltransferase [Longimycelium tulufanense]